MRPVRLCAVEVSIIESSYMVSKLVCGENGVSWNFQHKFHQLSTPGVESVSADTSGSKGPAVLEGSHGEGVENRVVNTSVTHIYQPQDHPPVQKKG